MHSDLEFIFVPQTSRMIMEINFSVSFNANNQSNAVSPNTS